MSVDALSQTLVEPGFSAAEARRALENWLADRDHPRCRKPMVEKMARALGVEARQLAAFQSKVLYHRGSPRKAKLLVDLIRGKKADEALNLLTFTTKRAAVNVKKCLSAAIADAEAAQADVTALVVTESRVDEGPRMKRFQPKDRGRAHPIIKAMSHITISVEEKSSSR